MRGSWSNDFTSETDLELYLSARGVAAYELFLKQLALFLVRRVCVWVMVLLHF
jgi:hypothetical protein